MPPPDRWEEYVPIGKQIPTTSFIAFKVPLREDLLTTVEEKDRFSPTILIQTLKNQGRTLGGIIDLTFTFKYYNKKDFESNSIKHWKIFTKGQEVPSEDVFQRFAKAVKSMEKEGTLIGVHCTHGVNRTGYLICRYMIEEMDTDPDIAIEMFNEARGHKLERENYLQDLKQRKKGESTYDPEYVSSYYLGADINKKIKERWRKNKHAHPHWRMPARDYSGSVQSYQGESNYHQPYRSDNGRFSGNYFYRNVTRQEQRTCDSSDNYAPYITNNEEHLTPQNSTDRTLSSNNQIPHRRFHYSRRYNDSYPYRLNNKSSHSYEHSVTQPYCSNSRGVYDHRPLRRKWECKMSNSFESHLNEQN